MLLHLLLALALQFSAGSASSVLVSSSSSDGERIGGSTSLHAVASELTEDLVFEANEEEEENEPEDLGLNRRRRRGCQSSPSNAGVLCTERQTSGQSASSNDVRGPPRD